MLEDHLGHGRVTQNGRVTSLYDAVGGEPVFRQLVDEFYAGVAEDPVLRPL